MLKKLSLFLVAASMLLGFGSAAIATELIVSFQSAYPGPVNLSFYSDTYKNREWPGDGQVYILDDYAVYDYNLACEPGEQISFGAWANNRPSTYWGSGDGTYACDNCVFTCGESYITQTLE